MEIWKDTVSIHGYQVSNYGRVKKMPCGIGYNSYERLKPKYKNADGYHIVVARGLHIKVHRLVAESFIPNPLNKETVNHIDGDKTNNHVDNLEWATRSEQMYHAYELGLKTPQRGHDNVNSKLTKDDVSFIRNNFKKGDRTFGSASLARKYNVSHRTILNVVQYKTYK